MSWEGFKYSPIQALIVRLQARRARIERKNFLKFLRQESNPSTKRGRFYMDLAHRVRRIHDDQRMTREQKQSAFSKVLQTYAAEMMKGRGPVGDYAAKQEAARVAE